MRTAQIQLEWRNTTYGIAWENEIYNKEQVTHSLTRFSTSFVITFNITSKENGESPLAKYA